MCDVNVAIVLFYEYILANLVAVLWSAAGINLLVTRFSPIDEGIVKAEFKNEIAQFILNLGP